MFASDFPKTAWRKSSYSGANSNCVEIVWRKSSYSSANSDCVEVAVAPDAVAARDSKNPTGPMLTVSPAAWHGFLAHLAAG